MEPRAMIFLPERSSVMEGSGSSSFTGFWGIGSPVSIWAALSITAAAVCSLCDICKNRSHGDQYR